MSSDKFEVEPSPKYVGTGTVNVFGIFSLVVIIVAFIVMVVLDNRYKNNSEIHVEEYAIIKQDINLYCPYIDTSGIFHNKNKISRLEYGEFDEECMSIRKKNILSEVIK